MQELTLILASAALGTASWVFVRVAVIDNLVEDVKYLRSRVDAIFDHLLEGEAESLRNSRRETNSKGR